MFGPSTRAILLLGSLSAAYFATWFGCFIGDFIVDAKNTGWSLASTSLVIVTIILCVIGLFSAILSVNIALRRGSYAGGKEDLSAAAGITALFLCYVYGIVAMPGSIPWYTDKWNLLLVFALTPSVFVAEGILTDTFSTKINGSASDNVRPFDRKSS